MCLFKKKKANEIIDSKCKLKERVAFHYRNELRYGVIAKIYKDLNNKVIYDINIGGECPTTIKEIKENKIIKY